MPWVDMNTTQMPSRTEEVGIEGLSPALVEEQEILSLHLKPASLHLCIYPAPNKFQT
jgi:hypothetical protein